MNHFEHRFGGADPDDHYDIICDACTIEDCDGYPCRRLSSYIWEDVALIESLEIEDKIENQ